MARRRSASAWVKAFNRNLRAMARATTRAPRAAKAVRARATARGVATGPGDWLPGLALGPGGARRYRLYRPPSLPVGEKVPLLVMLHGCGQDSAGFAASTRMNALARREGFLVLYPEQDHLAHPQRCWNWYDTRSGRAQAEASLIFSAIDQVVLLYAADPARIAVVGLSAGAGMAALLATREPTRFQAVVMHSGVAPGVAESTATALAAMRGRRLLAPDAAPAGPAAKPWPPLLVIQGGSDAVVSPSNGAAVARLWAGQLGASAGAPRERQRGQRHPMRVTDFQHRGRALVSLVEVPRLGHAWSGGTASQPYSDALGPDASRMAWAFVARQFRRTPGGGTPAKPATLGR